MQSHLKLETMNEMIQNSLFFLLFFFPDKHIDFWTTVEDGNLSQTFFSSLLLLFENTNIKLYFPHLRCERPPSTLVFIFTTGLEQAIQEDLKDAFRQSVRSVSSHGKKSVNIKKWASVRNGQGNQRE